MICLIWPWLTRLLMQPNTTSALGWREGLYWNANLATHTHAHHHWTFMDCVWMCKYIYKRLEFHTSVQVPSTDPTTCRQECPSCTPAGGTTDEHVERKLLH